MIQGKVTNLQAEVEVIFILPGRPNLRIVFVVDTGFAGALTLPDTVIAALQMPFLQEMTANLADDNSVKTDVHIASILWNGQQRNVAVLAMGRRPLLGTALLAGNQLVSNFVDGGLVLIEDIQP